MDVKLCLIFRAGHRLRVFEDRALRKIFGTKRDEEIGGWKNLHNEDYHNLYSSPSRMRWIEHVARMGSGGMHAVYWWKGPRHSLSG
jgi:hypothetical protein